MTKYKDPHSKKKQLPETASLHLKMDAWKTIRLPFGAFRPMIRVSGRICPTVFFD